MTKIALDLGCGLKPKNFFKADVVHGVDIRDTATENVVVADLAVEDIPYENEFFDFVTAKDFIEHIPRVVYLPQRRNSFVQLMNEIYRVLKPGGAFLSITPAFPHGPAWRDPTHVNIITEETFPLYFDDKHCLASMYGFYGGFRIDSQRWEGINLITAMVKTKAPEKPGTNN